MHTMSACTQCRYNFFFCYFCSRRPQHYYSPVHEFTCAGWSFIVRERCSGSGLNIPADCAGLSGMVLLSAWVYLFKGPNMYAAVGCESRCVQAARCVGFRCVFSWYMHTPVCSIQPWCRWMCISVCGMYTGTRGLYTIPAVYMYMISPPFHIHFCREYLNIS
jgi:hypothetical protein